MSMTPRDKKITITANPVGYGSIEVDGQDVTNSISGFEVRSKAGEGTEIILYTARPDVSLDLEGAVYIVDSSAQPSEAIELCVALLKELNPEMIQAAVLDELSWGDDQSDLSLVQKTISTIIGVFEHASSESQGHQELR
jgi:hypothetical protein